ncbi:fibrinogen alpha chain isoform X2 [Lepisosteus oculatus]|nr:PREDICTED: fibrinogen alpha chain-like isoform X2 [Lepisosteus oculatus]XP_015200190.1 PREDICTED: fibrinogen alpha chain-like isoform X2 [Lepisosteus oculatus]
MWTQPAEETQYKRKAGRCFPHKDYPLCVDDDWGTKCPSGCRIQGLIHTTETKFFDKFNQICQKIKMNEIKTEASKVITKQTYTTLRKSIVTNYVSSTKYMELTEELQRKLAAMQQRTIALFKKIKAQYDKIEQQMAALYQTEVDIDMKIRSCKGSCEKAFSYSIDQESYDTVKKQLYELDKIFKKEGKPGNGKTVKMRTITQEAPKYRSYKSIAIVRHEHMTLFEDIELQQLVLENHFPEVPAV